MSPQATQVCALLARIDAQQPLDPNDAEVLTALIHGLYYSGDMRALLHGLAAGMQAQFIQQGQTDGQESR
jgi:hypothetical protein